MFKLLSTLALSLCAITASALSFTVSWNQNTETNLVGYFVKLGSVSDNRSVYVDYPSTTCTLSNISYNVDYSVTVAASNSAGLVGDDSAPVLLNVHPSISQTYSNGNIIYTFPSSQYTLQSSTNLINWVDVDSGSPFTVNPNLPYCFYRLRLGAYTPSNTTVPFSLARATYGTGANSSTVCSVNASNGQLIVLSTSCETDLNSSISTSYPPLSWTLLCKSSAAQSGDCEIWSANVTASANYSVTNTWSGASRSVSAALYLFDGAKTTNGVNVASQTNPSLTVASVASNSVAIVVSSDWNAQIGTITYRNTVVPTVVDSVANKYQSAHYRFNIGAPNSVVTGESAPSNQRAGSCAVVVMPVR